MAEFVLVLDDSRGAEDHHSPVVQRMAKRRARQHETIDMLTIRPLPRSRGAMPRQAGAPAARASRAVRSAAPAARVDSWRRSRIASVEPSIITYAAGCRGVGRKIGDRSMSAGKLVV